MRREDCAGMILGALMDRLDVGRPGRVLDIGRFCFSRPTMTITVPVWRVLETRRTSPQAFTTLRFVKQSRLQDTGSLRPPTLARSERLLVWYYSSQSPAHAPAGCLWSTIKHIMD